MTQKYAILSTYGKLAIPLEAMAHLSGMKIVDTKGYGTERVITEQVDGALEFEVVDGSKILPPINKEEL